MHQDVELPHMLLPRCLRISGFIESSHDLVVILNVSGAAPDKATLAEQYGPYELRKLELDIADPMELVHLLGSRGDEHLQA